MACIHRVIVPDIVYHILNRANGRGQTNLAEMNDSINAAMSTLATAAGDPAAGTYALSHPDLSGFSSY